MDLPRSTFYAEAEPVAEDPAVSEIKDFNDYRYRRVTAELHHRGMIVNSKKVWQIMRENDLNPKRKRHYVITTDSQS